jgi:DNA repair exonuclease SbcCD ATPase subunit
MALQRLARRRSRSAREELARQSPPAPDPPAPDPRARKLVAAWSEAAHLRERLTEREQELAAALMELLKTRAELAPLRAHAGLQERIAELEQEATSFAQRRDDAIAASLRERLADREHELRDLTRRLAAAEAAVEPRRAEPPPWSALDDELLARIETTGALTAR